MTVDSPTKPLLPLHTSQVALQARAYPGFLQHGAIILGVVLLHSEWDASPGNHLYT